MKTNPRTKDQTAVVVFHNNHGNDPSLFFLTDVKKRLELFFWTNQSFKNTKQTRRNQNEIKRKTKKKKKRKGNKEEKNEFSFFGPGMKTVQPIENERKVTNQ
jgi:hypothetical protein